MGLMVTNGIEGGGMIRTTITTVITTMANLRMDIMNGITSKSTNCAPFNRLVRNRRTGNLLTRNRPLGRAVIPVSINGDLHLEFGPE